MSTISHREMRNQSAEVLRRVEAGEEIVVTNHGRPVARLTPMRTSTLDELVTKGSARPALKGASWSDLPPAAASATSSRELVADVRGYDREH